MSWKILLCTGLLCVVASPVWAVPQVRVIQSPGGSPNQNWKIQVQPDAALLWSNPQIGGAEGASLDVEIGVTFSNAVMTATQGTLLPDVNPGNNPFTGAVSNGVVMNGSTVFAAAGGPVSPGPLFPPFPGDTNIDNTTNGDDFTTLSARWDPGHICAAPGGVDCPAGRADADFDGTGFVDGDDFTTLSANWLKTFWIDVADVTTAGEGGTASWGGQNVTPVGGGPDYVGSRVAQAGSSFDGISGSSGAASLSAGGGAVPEPASALLLVVGAIMLGGRRLRR